MWFALEALLFVAAIVLPVATGIRQRKATSLPAGTRRERRGWVLLYRSVIAAGVLMALAAILEVSRDGGDWRLGAFLGFVALCLFIVGGSQEYLHQMTKHEYLD